MPKFTESLTPLEVSLINALCIAHVYTGDSMALKGRGVALIIGGAWSTGRHKVMLRLERHGYIRCFKCDRAWYYLPLEPAFTVYNQAIEKLPKMLCAAADFMFRDHDFYPREEILSDAK